MGSSHAVTEFPGSLLFAEIKKELTKPKLINDKNFSRFMTLKFRRGTK
jgi:hypothetical protein